MLAAADGPRTFKLRQHNILDGDKEPTGGTVYLMNMFVGRNSESRWLLVDTQANGTAINYNYEDSRYAEPNKALTGKIDLASEKACYIDGYVIFDQVCFDKQQEICLED